MKTLASTSSLLALCVACGVLSLGFGSCSSSSSAGGGGGGARDAEAEETTAARDGAAGADSGGALDAGPRDTGVVAQDSAPEDSGSCGEPQTALGTMCDECLQTSCEPSWCACAAGEPDSDAGDAGSGCLQYVQCVQACVESDAGSPTDCLTTVCATAPFTAPQQQAGHSFLDCLVQYCGSECGQ
jgi:hypothetical protein